MSIFSFGRFGGSKDTEKFNIWSEEVLKMINEGNSVIETFKDISDKENNTLEEYTILESRLEILNPLNYSGSTFSLKGKEKDSFEKISEELQLFINDYEFFLEEIKRKKKNFEKIISLNKDLDNYQKLITENESKQQLLARTVPRVNTTAELQMIESELEELKTIVPKSIDMDLSLPDDLQVRIERTNIKLGEWFKKLEFIENSVNKYRSKIENTVQEQAQKQNLSKIHTWLDSSETRIIKLTDKIKKVKELVSDETTSSKDLVNSLKEIEKISNEINEIKPPEVELLGEKQTQIGIDFRIKELSKLQESLSGITGLINKNITYRIAFIRSSILEKMFLKSHQLSFKQVNYSLGYKNDLLIQSWLQQPDVENQYSLRNHQNKYLMFSKEGINSLKESSEKLFESLQALTDYELHTNEVSYNQSLKWLLQNEDKWIQTNS